MPDTTDPTPLAFQPSRLGRDTDKYEMSHIADWSQDPVASYGVDDLARLASSDHWEDRVRAELLRQHRKVTLPDQFPCIYETADSPNQSSHKYKRPKPWVISPDIEMLHALLPDYQELWDAYTSQWGPTCRRTFAVGHLDGLHPHGIYRPGTTPAQVIGSTMLAHDMYRHAPERLRRMHPQYDQWQADKAERMSS